MWFYFGSVGRRLSPRSTGSQAGWCGRGALQAATVRGMGQEAGVDQGRRRSSHPSRPRPLITFTYSAGKPLGASPSEHVTPQPTHLPRPLL